MQSSWAVRRYFIGWSFGILWGLGLAQATIINEAQPIVPTQPTANEEGPQKASASISQAKTQHTSKLAAPSQDEEEEEEITDEGPNDPLEPLNRLIFGLNDFLDFLIVRPVAEIYRAVLPEPMRNGVRNVLDNLYAPVVFLNHVLQGEPERATVTVFRMLMNSSFGILGLVDVSKELGYPRYDTDFNQTLARWGVDTGPYLVLPLIGPASFRGTVGFIGDYYADPLNMYLNNRAHRKYRYWLTIRYGLDMVSQREKLIETLDNLEKTSPDMYVTLRSIYFQRQKYLVEKLRSSPVSSESEKGEGENKS